MSRSGNYLMLTQEFENLKQEEGKAVSVRELDNYIAELKKDGKIKRTGSNKAGYWEVL